MKRERDPVTNGLQRYTDGEYLDLLEEQILLERARREARRTVDAEERPPAQWPDALTLRDRLALPIEEAAWRIEGWLPMGGRVVMAAQAKTGKTTAAMNIVRCLVDGYPWMGHRGVVTPVAGRVAVLDFEMSTLQLDAWYRGVGISNDDRVLMLPMRGRGTAFDLRDDETRSRWAQLFVANDVEFVVWDCLRPVMDSLGLDEHRDAGTLLTAFDALLDECGKPGALVVHHMGHAGERARGDSRIRDWPDVEWKLVRGGDDPSAPRYISAYGRDVDQPETRYSQDPITRRMDIVGGSRADAKLGTAVEAVRELLRAAAEPLTKTSIESALQSTTDVSRGDGRAALQHLIGMGEVTVEIGERNAQLHRLADPSSPVRGNLPQFAGGVARQFAGVRQDPDGGVPRQSAAVPIGRRGGEDLSELDLEAIQRSSGVGVAANTPPASELAINAEQVALLARLSGAPPARHEGAYERPHDQADHLTKEN